MKCWIVEMSKCSSEKVFKCLSVQVFTCSSVQVLICWIVELLKLFKFWIAEIVTVAFFTLAAPAKLNLNLSGVFGSTTSVLVYLWSSSSEHSLSAECCDQYSVACIKSEKL